MNERVREMWQQGRTVYHLGFGESRFPVPAPVAEALRSNAHQRSYLPAVGMIQLREAIARFYRRRFLMDVSAQQVVIGPGSKSLLYALIMALGHKVILPQPSWVSYSSQALLAGKPVLTTPMHSECGYCLDVELVQERLEEDRATGGNPDLLVVNTPHNPTGTMMSPDEAGALGELARAEKLTVVCDEIYALVTHGRVPHASVAQHYPEGSIVLGGLSKQLSLGGWRFGLAILPPGRAGETLRQTLQNIAQSIWSCVAAPVQHAALVAYGDSPEIDDYVKLCACMHAHRTQYLYTRLAEAGIDCIQPAGAFYVYPSFRKWSEPLAAKGVNTSDDLAAFLLERYELAALPGTAFGSPPSELSLRLSSSYLDAETDEGADRLVKAFEEDPDPRRFISEFHPGLQEAAARFAEFAAELERSV
jgi:aspartate/methionine/tyrosine aminotransferase